MIVNVPSLKRSSEGELLRLICMLMIVMHHFVVHSVFNGCADFGEPLSLSNGIATVINAFCFIGVNCFILLSGYYGIRMNRKRLLNLYIICAFYGLVGYLIHLYVDHQNIGQSIMYNSIFIFSHSSWWYINCYLMLFMAAPLLNKAIEHFTKHEHLMIIGLFTIANLYFGYFWQTKGFNIDGYTVAQFIYLYIIGRYLRLYKSEILKMIRWKSFLVYVACAGIWCGLTMLHFLHNIPFWYPYTYNNPLVILGSIAFFCFLMSFKFQNRVVNRLAVSALAVYLIQDNCYIGHGILHPCIREVVVGFPIGAKVGAVLTLSTIFMLAAIMIDKVRILLMYPINYILDYYRKNEK